MKNNLLIALFLLLSSLGFAQVGINNTDPKASLDVKATATDGSKPEGIIAPRLTGNQIKAADLKYGTDQKGAIVYATAAVTGATAKTINITTEGYYYFNGSIWQKFNFGGSPDVNIFKDNGTLTSERTINNNGNQFRFTGTGVIETSAAVSAGDEETGGRVGLNPGGINNTGIMSIRNTSGNRIGYIGWDNTNLSYVTEGTAKHVFNGGSVGIGKADSSSKLAVSGDGTNPPLKLENLMDQPASGVYNQLSVNDAGEVYKNAKTTVPHYYLKYSIKRVQMKYLNDFDTKIPTNKYVLMIVGQSFSTLLSVANTTSNINYAPPQNVNAYQSGGTWHIRADYPGASTIDFGSGPINGDWTFYTLIVEKSNITSNPTMTVDLGGVATGTAPASPVP